MSCSLYRKQIKHLGRFMAVYTSLDRELISRLLCAYDVGELEALEPVSSGIENTNYFVWTKKEDHAVSAWVLTIFENLHEQQLPFFNRLTAHLADQGFPVPAPVIMRDGADYFRLSDVVSDDKRNKFGVLVPRFSGQAKEQHTLNECQLLAEFLARMHLALERFPAIHNVDHDSAWFESRVLSLSGYVSPEVADLLEHAWQRYQGYVDSLNACSTGIVHGDLFRDNVLFDEYGISGVIDFYHAGFSPLLFDLAVVANDWAVIPDSNPIHLQENHGDIDQPVYDESRMDALIQAYIAIRPLTQMELEVWPRFLEMAAFRFWLSRLKTLFQPGYQEHIKQGDCIKSPDAMKRILLAAMQR